VNPSATPTFSTSLRKLAASFVLGALFLGAGCQGEVSQNLGNMQLSVSLQGGQLELIEMTEVGELPNPPVGGASLRYVFQPADGAEIVEGNIRDTRILRSEFDRAGQADPQQVISEVGIFDVRVPAVAGRLELLGPAGESLGALDMDPEAPVTRSMALMTDADIIGQPVKIVDKGDSSKKVDILFLPEGYQENEMDQFHAHVDEIVAQMQTHSGYREHWDGFNIWRQDVRSRDSGTGSNGRPLRTAFDTAAGVSGLERCVFFTNPAGLGAARRLARNIGADATVVLANSTGHGGCASDGVVVSARPRWVADVVSHELGHGLFGLADEYESPSGSGYCSTGPNVSSSARAESLPWADLLSTSELPTPPSAGFGTIGAFEGGGYCSTGRYRPTHNCMMRTLGAGMCPVCRREMARTMASLAPADTNIGAISVKNESGGDTWVRCDGATRNSCSDWTFVTQNQTVQVRSPDGRLILHNIDIVAPVAFDFARVTATGAAVTLYPNATNPLVPPTVAAAMSTPVGLAPDLTFVYQRDVELKWNDIAAADVYRVVVEIEESGAWRDYDDQEVMTPSVRVMLANVDTRYRWRVTACGAGPCSASLQAIFRAKVVTANTDPPASNTASTVVPKAPVGLSPAHEAVASGSPVRVSWNAPAGAQYYNVVVRRLDSVTNQWLDHSSPNNLSQPGLDVTVTIKNTWYIWTLQACNDLGCSDWTEYSLFYANP
jgi:hypothetical protein